jgi:hypothetical protein
MNDFLQARLIPRNFTFIPSRKPILFVLILAETETRDLCQSYTGPIDNQPFFSNLSSPWIKFTNAYACAVFTEAVMARFFTSSTIENDIPFSTADLLYDYLHGAKFQTLYLFNGGDNERFHNVGRLIRHFTNKTVYTSVNYQRQRMLDAAMLPHFKEFLSGMDNTTDYFVTLQMVGAHAPLHLRVPNGLPLYNIKERKYLGRMANYPVLVDKFNLYNSAVLLGDNFTKKAFELIRDIPDREICFVYMADHGSNIFTMKYDHTPMYFHFRMVRIPFFFWANSLYRESHAEQIANLQGNANKIFTNDLTYDLLLSLVNIKPTYYEAKHDLSSEKYVTDDSSLLGYNHTVGEDPFLIQERNILKFSNLVILHTNTIYKTFHAKKLNAHSFHVDVFYNGSELMVGYDKDKNANITFSEFYDYLSDYKFLFLTVHSFSMSPDNFSSLFPNLKHERIRILSGNYRYLNKISAFGYKTVYQCPKRCIDIPFNKFEGISGIVLLEDSALVNHTNYDKFLQINTEKLSSKFFEETVSKYTNFTQLLVHFDGPYSIEHI